MKKIMSLLALSILLLNSCFYVARSNSSSVHSPCRWPVKANVLFQAKNELHQLWSFKDNAVFWSHLLPSNSTLYDFRAEVRQRIKTLDPFKRFEQLKPLIPPKGEAYNPYLAASKQAGKISPINCLEALLMSEQTARKPMLTEPTEFGAFLLKRQIKGQTHFKIYYSTFDRPGLKLKSEITEKIIADKQKGWLLWAHLHNHNFFFNESDPFASPSPSKTDVQLARRFKESLQLQEMWVTNGFHTIHIEANEFNLFKAHGDRD